MAIVLQNSTRNNKLSFTTKRQEKCNWHEIVLMLIKYSAYLLICNKDFRQAKNKKTNILISLHFYEYAKWGMVSVFLVHRTFLLHNLFSY